MSYVLVSQDPLSLTNEILDRESTMTRDSSLRSDRSRQLRLLSTSHETRAASLASEVFLNGLGGAFLAAGGLLFVVLVALLDHQTSSRFSFSLFYLMPVAACAWWGGFSHGILLALAGAIAWHLVDSFQYALLSPTVGAWNGIVRFCVLTLVSSLVSRLHLSIRRERLLARTDPLTGAANGRTFYTSAAVEVEQAGRSNRPLTLAYFDLDNFKQLNDKLGHAAGDEALRQVVQTVRSNLRRSDLLARMGGDEFALMLPETGSAEALDLLGRLQGVLAQEMVRRNWPVTLSLGAITFLRPPADVDLMIQQVDVLMYQAKKKGKARIEHEVVQDIPQEEVGRWVERRATARVLGNCTARVRPEGQDGAREEFASVRDLSTLEIRLHLEKRFGVGTLLLVEPLLPGAMTLLVRVVRAAPDQGGWEHGCELSTRLSEEDVRRWLGFPAESVCR
jgi:diguanylate cyclase (GGDEF)-like protein